MNTLENFGYDAKNFINLENWEDTLYAPENMFCFFSHLLETEELHGKVVKSHYDGYFMLPCIPMLYEHGFRFFYIYRNVDAVMMSFMKHIKSLPWHAGPVCETMQEFRNAQPYGSCMRYQFFQYATMESRWNGHVKSWFNMPDEIKGKVCFIMYEELDSLFDDVVQNQIAPYLDMAPPENIKRPVKWNQVIIDGKFLVDTSQDEQNNQKSVG